MPINIIVSDDDLEGFNDNARTELTTNVQIFITDLIRESNRLESSFSLTSSGPEITSNIVKNAVTVIRQRINKPRQSAGLVTLKIISNIFSLVVGWMFQPDKLKELGSYFYFFILVAAATIILITISTLKND